MWFWKLFHGRLSILLLAIAVIGSGVIQAAPQAKKGTVKRENSPIVGELDENEALPPPENDDMSADEVTVTSINPPENQKNTGDGLKNKGKTRKDQLKEKKAEEKRKILMEGFKKAEDFHKTWYNLPVAQIKTSLEKLTMFCKSTCTKSQCRDEEVANHCHLMCPDSTTKLCPDPLKQANDKDMENAEAMPMLPLKDVSPDPLGSPSPDVDQLDEGAALVEGEEGG